MARLTYRVSAPVDQVAGRDAPPVEPSRTLLRVEWDFDEPSFTLLPQLRTWLHHNEVFDVEELGMRVEDAALPEGGLSYTVRGTPWRSWSGPPLVREEPCGGCGLPIRRTKQGAAVNAPVRALRPVVEALADAPMCFLAGPDVWVARREFLDRVVRAGFDGGLQRTVLTSEGPGVIALWSDESLGGPGYPFGPEPCEVCGRASRTTAAGLEFVRPRYAFELAVRPSSSDWSWCTVYGDAYPLLSAALARWLHREEPQLAFTRHPPVDAEDAFLAVDFRGGTP